jgi:hypothetical protein
VNVHVRHVSSCLWCGYREAVRLGNAYPPRCPNDGRELEQMVATIDDVAELRRIRKDGQDSRRPTHSYSVRRAA